MNKDFDENGELVINHIPDEVIAEIGQRAARRGWSVDEELRNILTETYGREAGEMDLELA
jgi:plasmid stability protein